MSDDPILILTVVSAVGCGLNAGVVFAFSAFVMKALRRLSVPQGIAAMQHINKAAINPLFLVPFFVTAAACLLLIIVSLLRGNRLDAVTYIGCILYLVGTVLVTALFNVPLNNELAAVDPAGDEGAGLWARYLANWTAWNHVRAAAALAAAVMLTIALCR